MIPLFVFNILIIQYGVCDLPDIMRFQTQFHFSFEIAAARRKALRMLQRRRRNEIYSGAKTMTGKSGKDEKKPRSQPESLGYSAINVGWIRYSRRESRGAERRNSDCYTAVSIATRHFSIPAGDLAQRGKRFACPFERWLGLGICRNP